MNRIGTIAVCDPVVLDSDGRPIGVAEPIPWAERYESRRRTHVLRRGARVRTVPDGPVFHLYPADGDTLLASAFQRKTLVRYAKENAWHLQRSTTDQTK